MAAARHVDRRSKKRTRQREVKQARAAKYEMCQLQGGPEQNTLPAIDDTCDLFFSSTRKAVELDECQLRIACLEEKNRQLLSSIVTERIRHAEVLEETEKDVEEKISSIREEKQELIRDLQEEKLQLLSKFVTERARRRRAVDKAEKAVEAEVDRLRDEKRELIGLHLEEEQHLRATMDAERARHAEVLEEKEKDLKNLQEETRELSGNCIKNNLQVALLKNQLRQKNADAQPQSSLQVENLNIQRQLEQKIFRDACQIPKVYSFVPPESIPEICSALVMKINRSMRTRHKTPWDVLGGLPDIEVHFHLRSD